MNVLPWYRRPLRELMRGWINLRLDLGAMLPATMPLTEIELKGALWCADVMMADMEVELEEILQLLWGGKRINTIAPPSTQRVLRGEEAAP